MFVDGDGMNDWLWLDVSLTFVFHYSIITIEYEKLLPIPIERLASQRFVAWTSSLYSFLDT